MKIRVPSPCRTLYWKWKQRGLDIRTWDDLLDEGDFDGASVAIVGNAGYLDQTTLGAQIDRHDLVLRMNNFPVRGFEKAVGSRIDIFMTNFASMITNYEEPLVRQTRFIVASRPNNFRKHRLQGLHHAFGRNLTAGMTHLGCKRIYAPPLDLFCDYSLQLGIYPTTGAMAILLALDVLAPRCGPIFLTGFSFFQGRSHYFSDAHVDAAKDHNVLGEQELFRRRLMEPVHRGQVTVDPVMASHLWPDALPQRHCA